MFYLVYTAKSFSEKFDSSIEIVQNIAWAIGIAVFVILNVLLYRSEKRKKKFKQQAEENNTFITARRVRGYRIHDSDGGGDEFHGDYEYTVNGKTKTCRIFSEYSLPDTMKMYPKNSEGTKFFPEYDGTAGWAIAFNGLAAIAAGIGSYCLMLQILIG